MADDLLNQIAKKAVRKKVEPKQKNEVVWYPEANLENAVVRLIEAGYVADMLKPVLESRKSLVGEKLLELYINKMWETKQQPDNPRIVIRKKGSETRDMAFMFLVKFRKDALKKDLPSIDVDEENEEEVPTPHELLANLLLESVGLSEANIKKITDTVSGEFQIVEDIDLIAPFNVLYYSDNPVHKSAATKLLTYLNSPIQKGKKKIELEPFTDKEKEVVSKTQSLVMKEGFLQRVVGYCDTIDQLRDLLKFVKVSLVCQNFEYSIGDEPTERNKRLEKAVQEMLIAE